MDYLRPNSYVLKYTSLLFIFEIVLRAYFFNYIEEQVYYLLISFQCSKMLTTLYFY